MAGKRNALAIILGGGQGTRLFPLTLQRSKPAVPLGGKYRLIDITVSNCINSGITNIYILTQFNSASLNRHIARTYRFSRFSDGFVEILAAEQTPDNRDWFQGTADAVRQVMLHILEFDPAYVVILSGDHLYQMNYRQFLDRHIDSRADVSVSVIPCAADEASNYGLVKTDAEGIVTEFREKPPPDLLEEMRVDPALSGLSFEEAYRRPYLASMGVYVFSLEALRDLLKDGQHQDFGGEVIPAAIKQHKVQSFLFDGYWEDIGTISAFYHANLDMTSIMPKFNLFDADSPIFTRPRVLPGSKLIDCEVRNSIITDGCIVNRASIINSIIGLRSRIGNFSRIEYSLLMGADYYQTIDDLEVDRRRELPFIGVGERTVIRRAIIDKNVRIGSNVRILNEAERIEHDGENYYIREGIVVVPKGAIITDGTII
jgi:glucose-1-phosphate adenylyltransferase